jgi:hypothetical protein
MALVTRYSVGRPGASGASSGRVILLTSNGLSDLADVRTRAEFVAYLKGVQRRSGKSLGDLERAGKALAAADPRFRALPTSTVSDMLSGKRPIKLDLLKSLLTACQVVPSEYTAVLDTWQRINTVLGRGPANAPRVDEVSPHDLGVHPAISSNGEPNDLPSYVRRDFDDELERRIVRGVDTGHGCFVLLIGGPSQGKTRSLYEVVRVTLSDWWLVQPARTQDIHDFRATPTERTVLWLDDFHRYLGADPPLLREHVVELLRATGMIVVGTIRPDSYFGRKRTPEDAGNEYVEHRLLLDVAQLISVPDTFTVEERQRAKEAATHDVRIRAALAVSDAGVTQVLAAAPDLVNSWEHAPNAYGKAIISVAADAVRLGVQSPLRAEVLVEAMADYLTPAQRATPTEHWLELALDHATTRLHGAVPALSPVSHEQAGKTDGYEVADYLTGHIGRVRRAKCPPESLWTAVSTHVNDQDDLRRLAGSAFSRMRYQCAEQALLKLQQIGDRTAPVQLAALLRRQNRLGEAIMLADDWLASDPADQRRRILRAELIQLQLRAEQLRLGATDDERMRDLLAELLTDGGRADALRTRAGNGDEVAREDLAELLARRGCLDELEDLADGGNLFARDRLASVLAGLGREDSLERRATLGDPIARRYLDRMRERDTDVELTSTKIAQLQAASDGGDQKAAAELLELLFNAGDGQALLAEVNAGTHQAAERFIALRTLDSAADRGQVRRIMMFGLRANGSPAGPGGQA